MHLKPDATIGPGWANPERARLSTLAGEWPGGFCIHFDRSLGL
jgi:hypothetical protein